LSASSRTDGNSAPGVCGLPNDSFTDPVVEVGGEARFLPSPSGQSPLGRFGPLPLEVAPQSSVALAKAGVERTAECLTVTVGGDVATTKINTEVIGRITFRHVANIDGHVEEEHAVPIDQVRLTSCPFKQRGLIGPANPGHDLSAIVGQDRDTIRTLPREDALVVDDGAVRSECWLAVFVSLVDLDHLGDGADGHLSAEAEVAADVVVGEFLQLNLVRASVGEGNGGERVTGSIETLHRPQHGISLLGQLALDAAGMFRRPREFPLREFSAGIFRSGITALPVTMLVGFLVGIVLTYLSALQLKRYGADLLVINIVGVGVVRELGPMLASIISAGRSGSAITAQLGVMRVTE